MYQSHKSFNSVHGKRQILIVDDEEINREILSEMLSEEFEILTAENGKTALDVIRRNSAFLSAVLLDVLMPEMNGFEVLHTMKEDPLCQRIPVIVLTTEKDFEVKALRLGAADFIKKPYDLPEVVRARVDRAIELSEDTLIIQTAERDPLTDLYHPEFFFQYAHSFKTHHPDAVMDAIFLDISHFQLVNELYGKEYGNDVLIKLADRIRSLLSQHGGIACRKDADIFLIYCPHREDHLEKTLAYLQAAFPDREDSIRLRMGVCFGGRDDTDLRILFDHAHNARDSVKASRNAFYAEYSDALHEEHLYRQRLIAEMEDALKKKQFRVFFQPKFNVKGAEPALSSAEALVRWQHPQLGMISPGVFIPLFEENGQISRLDRYVWSETAAQMRAWRDRFGFTLPISVNVSRVDLFDPELIPILNGIVEENGLKKSDFLLEITESAYTDNSAQMIAVVEKMRDEGFRIEMDDFGSGYSSLNMLTQIPIDILKLDMGFVRNLNKNEKNNFVLKAIMQLKKDLSVLMVAEGVETEEQLSFLKNEGCDIIQGYYFSPPVPPEKFESFLEERARQLAAGQ